MHGQAAEVKKAELIPREDFILRYLPLVKHIVDQMDIYLPTSIDKEDLIEAGIIGLIDAVDRFDPKKNCEFTTYARFRIKGAILDQLRNLDWVPKSIRQKARKLETVYRKIESELGHPPSDQAMADALGITEEEYHRLLYKLKGAFIVSLEDESLGLRDSDSIYDPDNISTLELVISKEQVSVLSKAIEELPERERLVVSLYYFEELTMKEIGEVLGLAKSTISELHARALMHLRSKLKDMQ